MSECDSKHGRLKEICEGRADVPLEVITRYRQRWGMTPLPVGFDLSQRERIRLAEKREVTARKTGGSCSGCGSTTTTDRRPIVRRKPGPGFELKRIMKGKGLPHCQACKDLAEKMDEWAVEGCKDRLEEIIEDIMPRARDWVEKQHPWASALFPNCIKDIEIRRRVTRYVLQAIEAAEMRDDRRARLRRDVFRPRLRCGAVAWQDNAEPIVRIVTAIRTSFRQKPTLENTIASMAKAGFEAPLVFAEPDAQLTDEPAIRFEKQLKPFRSFVAAADHLTATFPSQWLLVCEDDVEFQTGCADDLRALPIDTTQIVSLYVSTDQGQSAELKPGVNVLTGDIHGSLAYLVHGAALRAILDSSTFENWSEEARVDRAFSQAAEECGLSILVHSPSWTQHTGATSTIRPTRRLTSGRISDFRSEISERPLLTLITPTGDRPESFALCERWISRQRYQGDLQWIVVDDGQTPTKCTMGQQYIRREPMDGHTLCANLRAAIPHIRGERLLIIEDDDYYGPDYFSTMMGQLAHADFVGERGAKYYYVKANKWRHLLHHDHVSLCRIGMTAAVFETLKHTVEGTNHESVDLRLRESWTGSKRTWADPLGDMRLCVGIKGGSGRRSRGHQVSSAAVPDVGKAVLHRWIGDDWEAYQGEAVELVAYSVNIGAYDDQHRVRPGSVPFLIVMDDDSIRSEPRIIADSSEPKKQSRWFKTHGCHLFPAAEWILYFDANLIPKSPLIEFSEWLRGHGEADLYLFQHNQRPCLYREAEAIIKSGKASESAIRDQTLAYRLQGVPENLGLYQGSVHLRRNCDAVRQFEKRWWNEIARWSHRDQLSLPVALHNSGVRVKVLPPLSFLQFFDHTPHKN